MASMKKGGISHRYSVNAQVRHPENSGNPIIKNTGNQIIEYVHGFPDDLVARMSVIPYINILPESSMSRSSGILFPSSTHWR
jgi:hypothetical protein